MSTFGIEEVQKQFSKLLSISSLTIKQLADTDAEQNLQVTTSMLS
jgi:hypothetical protein